METKDMNIHQRLLAVMGEVDYIQKDLDLGKYMGISHDKVTRSTRDLFKGHGILVVPSVIQHESPFQGVTRATVETEFINVDNPEDKISIRSFGDGIDKQDKGPGKATSYACKYAILKILQLETGDDPDKEDDDIPVVKITDEQLITLRDICDSKGFPIDETLASLAKKVFRIKRIEDLPETHFENAKERLNKKEATL